MNGYLNSWCHAKSLSLCDLCTPLRNLTCLQLIQLKCPSVSKNVLGNKLSEQRIKLDLIWKKNDVLRTQEEPKAAEALGSNRETSVNSLEGIRVSSSKEGMEPIVQANASIPGHAACSTGNKQEELEDSAQVKNCELIAITGTQWDELYDWSAVIDGYEVFRSDRQRRRCK